jgi:hypothetical protein
MVKPTQEDGWALTTFVVGVCFEGRGSGMEGVLGAPAESSPEMERANGTAFHQERRL